MDENNGNYMSLDPVTAMKGVRGSMTPEQLSNVAYEARCGAARRIALVQLDDQNMFEIFGRTDPDPMVRRGCARNLKNMDVLKEIRYGDADPSVREAACWQMNKLMEQEGI